MRRNCMVLIVSKDRDDVQLIRILLKWRISFYFIFIYLHLDYIILRRRLAVLSRYTFFIWMKRDERQWPKWEIKTTIAL